jgi:hypothetical protein
MCLESKFNEKEYDLKLRKRLLNKVFIKEKENRGNLLKRLN